MNHCHHARELFGAYWDDETTRAERDWLDAHFAACSACRADYEALARTLAAVAALPRVDAAPELEARALAAARAARTAPDRILVTATPAWVPAAAAAALVLVAALALAPWLVRTADRGGFASQAGRVAEPRLVAVTPPAGASGAGAGSTGSAVSPSRPSTPVTEALFDHSEDVDFVLEPVTVHRGRARSAARAPQGVQGDAAVISF